MAKKKTPKVHRPARGLESAGLATEADVRATQGMARSLGQAFPDASRAAADVLLSPEHQDLLRRHAAALEKHMPYTIDEVLALLETYPESYERRERFGWSFSRNHHEVVGANAMFTAALDAAANLYAGSGKYDPIRKDAAFKSLLTERKSARGGRKAAQARNKKKRAKKQTPK